MSLSAALLGTAVGVTAAVSALYVERQRRRRDDPSASVHDVIGIRGLLSSETVERRVVVRASAVAFPLFVTAVCLVALVVVGTAALGVLLGLAGCLFGLCCVGAGRRYRV